MIKKTLLALVLGAMASSAFASNGDDLPDLIKRGEYLAKAGDCEGCHTIGDGQRYGGGRAFETPIGTIYSTNISSSKKYGIGNFSYEDFVNAVQKGVAPRGNLYPAMPYEPYAKIHPADMKALYAYFMHTKPVNQVNRENDMIFPANIRFGLKFWNMLEVDDKPFKENPEKSAAWNRGAYLVESLGHCGECHTPRNLLMGSENDKALQGNVVNGLNAPNLTAQRLKREGWDLANLTEFLQTGKSAKGTAFGEMFIVEKHSLTLLDHKDNQAIATYLLDDGTTPNPVPSYPPVSAEQQKMPGYQVFMANCAGCHGNNGQGVPNVAPPLKGNATVANPNIYNTVAVLFKGIPTQRYNALQSYYAMPSYNGKLDAKATTDLLNFLHKAMADSAPAVTEKEVSDVMKKVK